MDRLCRELEANGTPHLSFHLDDFILKITVPKVVSQAESQINATAKSSKRTVNTTVNAQNATANSENLIKRLIEKATVRGEKLTANRISISRLMAENGSVEKKVGKFS